MKYFKYILGIALSVFLVAGIAKAVTVLYPGGGGTGTSQVPTYGKVLVGQSNGTYLPTATSSLNITSSATGNWTGTFDGQEGTYYLSRTNHTGTQGVSTLSNYDWTFSNNYGAVNLTGSTTAPWWAQGGLNASSTSHFVYASTTALTVSGNSYLGTVSSGAWNGTAIGNSYIDDDITLTNLTQITNRAITDTTGTLTVARGGTGQTSFGQGWLNSDGTTLSASTSPTVAYLTATSTTATSTFANGLELTGGCFKIGGTCLGGGSGTVTSVAQTVPAFLSISGSPVTTSGTLAITLSGTALPVTSGGTGWSNINSGYIPFGNGASAISTSTNLFWNNSSSYLGVGTSTPSSRLTVSGVDDPDGQFQINYTSGGTYKTVRMGVDSTGNLKLWMDGTAFQPLTNNSINLGLTGTRWGTLYTTNLDVSTESILGTVSSGIWNGTAIGDAYLTKTGNWTGTIDSNNFAGGAIGAGELIYGGSAGSFSELALGTNGYVLALSGGIPAWVATTTLSTISGTLDISSQSNLTCGTNCTLTGDDISVDDAFLLNTGDIGTGVYDFGGATSVEVPNGSPTVDTTGEIGIDTTSGQFKWSYNGSTLGVKVPYYTLGFTYATSSAWTGTTTILLSPAKGAQTFADVACETNVGTLGLSLHDGTNRANYIPTASTTINTNVYSTNNTFTANESRRVDIGTPASSPSKIACSFKFTYDQD